MIDPGLVMSLPVGGDEESLNPFAIGPWIIQMRSAAPLAISWAGLLFLDTFHGPCPILGRQIGRAKTNPRTQSTFS
jgi:hypothetical protein